MIPRHEYPGRIVLTIGLFTSSLCVIGLILLWLGWLGLKFGSALIRPQKSRGRRLLANRPCEYLPAAIRIILLEDADHGSAAA